MKILKNWWIFILLFITTSFVNFIEVLFDTCTIKICPDDFNIPVFTTYPNFFVEKMCGGFTGGCIPAHFSIWIFIFDILLAFVLFAIILGFIFVIRKILKR